MNCQHLLPPTLTSRSKTHRKDAPVSDNHISGFIHPSAKGVQANLTYSEGSPGTKANLTAFFAHVREHLLPQEGFLLF